MYFLRIRHEYGIVSEESAGMHFWIKTKLYTFISSKFQHATPFHDCDIKMLKKKKEKKFVPHFQVTKNASTHSVASLQEPDM